MVSGRDGIQSPLHLTPKSVIFPLGQSSVETQKHKSYRARVLDFGGIATMKIDAGAHRFHNISGSLPSFPSLLQSKLKSPVSKV